MKADASMDRSPPLLRVRLPDRLLRDGSQFLSYAELVAMLLHSSCRGSSAMDVACELLSDLGGLAGLGEVDGDLIERSGIGPVRASILLAARELAARLGRTRLNGRQILDRPGAVASYIALRYGLPDQEVLGVLLLDIRQRLITDHALYHGTLSKTAVEPRQVLRMALRHSAASVVLFPHPSQQRSTPSAEDLAFTRRMDSACRVVGVRLADHLVVGGLGRWVSLAERGKI